MDNIWKKARRMSGLARYERETRRKVLSEGRLRLAFNVPGTKEAGEIHMIRKHCNDIAERLRL